MTAPHDARAIVIKDGSVALTGPDMAPRTFEYIPAGLLTDAGSLLHWAGYHLPTIDQGVLLVPSLPAYGDDDWSIDQRADLMTQRAASAGWTRPVASRLTETGWVTWTHEGSGQRINMGVLDLIDRDRTPVADLSGTALAVALELAAYDRATGTPWRMTAGVTGCTMIRDMVERIEIAKTARRRVASRKDAVNAPRWHSKADPQRTDPATGVSRWARSAGDLKWSRPLFAGEKHGTVHHLDITGMFLAAASIAELPWGDLREVDVRVFDGRAGYWLVDAYNLPFGSTPPAACPNHGPDTLCPDCAAGGTWSTSTPPTWSREAQNADGTVYLTTPMMTLLTEYGVNPAVHHALVAPTAGRTLRPWAESIRDALYDPRTPQRTAAALKRTYAETIGMFNARGGTIYRPDWRDIIIDTARANLLRKVNGARNVLGVWPIRVNVDSVWYVMPDDTAATREQLLTALGGSGRLGKFRHCGSSDARDLNRKVDA